MTRRSAFVSGASRNIGRAIALNLAGQGINIVINSARDVETCERVAGEIRQLGVEALVLTGNVGDVSQAEAMAKAALKKFGTIDILVNNAAIRPHHDFLAMTHQDWTDVLNVDLNAAFWLSQAFLPGMIERKWGRIVNVTGMNAIQGFNGHSHVSAAKHGLWGLTKALAKEFGPAGITANAVSPGPIAADGGPRGTPERIAQIAATVPLGRYGTGSEVAAIIGMLCSDAGGYVSGQQIAVNGGTLTY